MSGNPPRVRGTLEPSFTLRRRPSGTASESNSVWPLFWVRNMEKNFRKPSVFNASCLWHKWYIISNNDLFNATSLKIYIVLCSVFILKSNPGILGTVPKKWNGLRATKWPSEWPTFRDYVSTLMQVHHLGGQTWPSIRPLNAIKVVTTRNFFSKQSKWSTSDFPESAPGHGQQQRIPNGFPSFILPQTQRLQRPHRLHDLWGSGCNLVFVGSVAGWPDKNSVVKHGETDKQLPFGDDCLKKYIYANRC